jgi:outer membrane receptor protein involved in Fe transport
LTVVTPLLLLNGQQVASFIQTPLVTALVQQYIAAGLDPATAQARALSDAQTLVPQLATALGSIPVGVVSSPEVAAQGADLVVTYLNMGGMEYWGSDLGFSWFATDKWTINGTYSHISKDYFQVDGVVPGTKEPVALNAPSHKATLGVSYRDVPRGLNAEARLRFNAEYPAVSAGYSGTKCLLEEGQQPGLFDQDCVAAAALVDLNVGYLIPNTRTTVQLSVSNLFNEAYRSFVGVPDIGRFAMLRVKYDLF